MAVDIPKMRAIFKSVWCVPYNRRLRVRGSPHPLFYDADLSLPAAESNAFSNDGFRAAAIRREINLDVRHRRVEREHEQQGKNDAFHDPNCGFNLPLAEVETSLAGIELYWRG